jgi:Protein of unknown function (DUF2877)
VTRSATPLPVAAPERVAAWVATAPDGPVAVRHRCEDAVQLDVAGRCVGLLSRRAPGLPQSLRSNRPVVSSTGTETAYLEAGILHWGALALVTGRLVEVRAPRIDPARVPGTETSPAGAEDLPRSLPAGLVALTSPLDAESVSALVGRGEGLTPLGDDIICGWLALHRALGEATPAVDDAVRRLLGRTTALSAALLECALLGEVADPVADHLRALGGDGTLDEAVTRHRLNRLGNTSGSGLAHGIDLARAGLSRRRDAA